MMGTGLLFLGIFATIVFLFHPELFNEETNKPRELEIGGVEGETTIMPLWFVMVLSAVGAFILYHSAILPIISYLATIA